ncbi:hypothetical protein L596_030924 [Steinernema carpocapsae]|uniref:SKP1 component POZ domain-containing protein n=1 Tax=Steinernema carpocapsae TaxID=34508 RepID=A0A4U5MH97_STECR|nr:hypothetical protein L596_030924 [Steinernema carpocapsae]
MESTFHVFTSKGKQFTVKLKWITCFPALASLIHTTPGPIKLSLDSDQLGFLVQWLEMCETDPEEPYEEYELDLPVKYALKLLKAIDIVREIESAAKYLQCKNLQMAAILVLGGFP